MAYMCDGAANRLASERTYFELDEPKTSEYDLFSITITITCEDVDRGSEPGGGRASVGPGAAAPHAAIAAAESATVRAARGRRTPRGKQDFVNAAPPRASGAMPGWRPYTRRLVRRCGVLAAAVAALLIMPAAAAARSLSVQVLTRTARAAL